MSDDAPDPLFDAILTTSTPIAASISPATSAPVWNVLGVAITFATVTNVKRLQDELRKAGEELQSAYEEIQSSKEELETTNEELQSTVEELETTNTRSCRAPTKNWRR